MAVSKYPYDIGALSLNMTGCYHAQDKKQVLFHFAMYFFVSRVFGFFNMYIPLNKETAKILHRVDKNCDLLTNSD